MQFGNKKKTCFQGSFSVLSQKKQHQPSGNLKFNYFVIFQSLILRISKGKIFLACIFPASGAGLRMRGKYKLLNFS